MLRRLLITTLLLGGALLLTSAGTKLVLIDGREIEGEEVRRESGNYVLRLSNGQEMTLPVELVSHVELTGEKEPPPPPPPPREDRFDPVTGLTYRADSKELGDPIPAGPSGMINPGPQQLAGDPVRAPTTQEQLAVFGKPAKFQKSIVDNSWHPTSDWDNNPEKNNNWAPSKWSKSIIDPNWEPTSAYDANADVLEGSQSTFSKSVIDNSWQPTDGFAK